MNSLTSLIMAEPSPGQSVVDWYSSYGPWIHPALLDSTRLSLTYNLLTFLALVPPILTGVLSSTLLINFLISSPCGPARACATASRPCPTTPRNATRSPNGSPDGRWAKNPVIFSKAFNAAWFAASYDALPAFLNVLPDPPEMVGKIGPIRSENVRRTLFRVEVIVSV